MLASTAREVFARLSAVPPSPGHVQFHRLGDQVVASAHLVRLHERLQVLDGVQRAVLALRSGSSTQPGAGMLATLSACWASASATASRPCSAAWSFQSVPTAGGMAIGSPISWAPFFSRALRVIIGRHPAQLAGKRTAYRGQVARAEGHHHSRPGGSPDRGPGGVALDQPGFAIALDPAESP